MKIELDRFHFMSDLRSIPIDLKLTAIDFSNVDIKSIWIDPIFLTTLLLYNLNRRFQFNLHTFFILNSNKFHFVQYG